MRGAYKAMGMEAAPPLPNRLKKIECELGCTPVVNEIMRNTIHSRDCTEVMINSKPSAAGTNVTMKN